MSNAVIVAPSLLSADFSRLELEVKAIEQAGADWIHVDVMDGRFVNNITLGPLVVQAIRPHTTLPLDVHLMIVEPFKYVEAFAKAGADSISVHAEMGEQLSETLVMIRNLGCRSGVVLNPASELTMIDAVLEQVDFVLLMTVNPGFGGQAFIEGVVPKIEALRKRLDELGLYDVPIEVDGGINAETAVRAYQAGARILVAGNAVFGAENRAEAIARIRAVQNNA
jgi:ribulose-phosphate 3-epimerase